MLPLGDGHAELALEGAMEEREDHWGVLPPQRSHRRLLEQKPDLVEFHCTSSHPVQLARK